MPSQRLSFTITKKKLNKMDKELIEEVRIALEGLKVYRVGLEALNVQLAEVVELLQERINKE